MYRKWSCWDSFAINGWGEGNCHPCGKQCIAPSCFLSTVIDLPGRNPTSREIYEQTDITDILPFYKPSSLPLGEVPKEAARNGKNYKFNYRYPLGNIIYNFRWRFRFLAGRIRRRAENFSASYVEVFPSSYGFGIVYRSPPAPMTVSHSSSRVSI